MQTRNRVCSLGVIMSSSGKAFSSVRRPIAPPRRRADRPQPLSARHAAEARRDSGTGSLLPYTRKITAPTVVVHGPQDPTVRPRNGHALARVIDGARYVVDGMGHDLPEPVWRPVVEALTENFAVAR